MTPALYTCVKESTMHLATRLLPTVPPLPPKYLTSSLWLSTCAFTRATSSVTACMRLRATSLLVATAPWRPCSARVWKSRCTRRTWKQAAARIHCDTGVPQMITRTCSATSSSSTKPKTATSVQTASRTFQPFLKKARPKASSLRPRSSMRTPNMHTMTTLHWPNFSMSPRSVEMAMPMLTKPQHMTTNMEATVYAYESTSRLSLPLCSVPSGTREFTPAAVWESAPANAETDGPSVELETALSQASPLDRMLSALCIVVAEVASASNVCRSNRYLLRYSRSRRRHAASGRALATLDSRCSASSPLNSPVWMCSQYFASTIERNTSWTACICCGEGRLPSSDSSRNISGSRAAAAESRGSPSRSKWLAGILWKRSLASSSRSVSCLAFDTGMTLPLFLPKRMHSLSILVRGRCSPLGQGRPLGARRGSLAGWSSRSPSMAAWASAMWSSIETFTVFSTDSIIC
mmetsp:Transcript_101069/g.271731  ORF Transcript_101069/g.271731 Transcript_101069/m.271731 type:complete len:463 (-) Transcript_101069:442-1830(-)